MGWSKQANRTALALTLAMTLSAGSCATMTGSAGTECAAWVPIWWSVEDTDETILQAKQHNAAGKAMGCWS